MSVQFVVGRAGSGKTWRCLEAIRTRLREGPCDGPVLLLLVPEQASFQMERALIETPGLAGYTRCQVVSFQRLAFRIFAETGADPRRGDQTIGTLGRLMTLRRLIRRERPGLRLLDRVADKPGLVKQLARTLDELMREQVDPQALAELSEQAEGDDPLAAARLADITRLYQAYLDYLIEDRLDPAQYLALAAEKLKSCRWIQGAEVWADGFAGFTAQEHALLVELARHTSSMEIALLTDPDTQATDSEASPSPYLSLFARTERTLIRLSREFKAAGCTVDPPIRLTKGDVSRFAHPELSTIESRLFATDAPAATQPPDANVVAVHEVPDRRAEVDAAIAEIRRLTIESDNPLRYRDVAIIVRDLAAYHDLLAAAMRSHGIPFFIDRRAPTTHHPLIEFVRALLVIGTNDLPLDAVRLTLKTGLLGLDTSACDELENYLLASGIAGRRTWNEPWRYTRYFREHKNRDDRPPEWQQEALKCMNAHRAAYMAALAPWLDRAAQANEHTGRAWAEALYACLEALKVGDQLQVWSTQAEADGRTDEADHHRQVWTDFVELLDEFTHALGNETMRIDEFRETIEAGLGEFDLGLAPATLDQVLIGSIERSRHPAIRAALILGFDEQHFPMRRREDPLIDDRQREKLETKGVELGATRRRQILDERMLAYIAMTRASERLYISYARSDAQGQPVQPSPFLADLQRALPGVNVQRHPDPLATRSVQWITSVNELGARLAQELRHRPPLEEDAQADQRALWNGLYEAVTHRTEWRAALKRSLAGLAYENRAQVDPALVQKILPDPFAASVSRLERFAACPFAHFSEYTLRLSERLEAGLQDVDLGTVWHAVLESFMNRLNDGNERLSDLEDDEIGDRITQIADVTVPKLSDEMMLTQARNAYLIDRSKGHLSRVTRWQRNAARVGRFRPIAAEFAFGFGDKTAGAITLKTPKGRTLKLRGFIDRVDVAEIGDTLLGMVIDYKRSVRRTLDLTAVYHGLALQLVGYLVAMKQRGESLAGRPIVPVAAFYLPLLEPYKTVSHPDEQKTVTYQLRGIADAEHIEQLDENVVPGGKSEFMSARLTKEGVPYATSDLAPKGQLSDLMTHVEQRMVELADDLLDGNIAVSPYRLRKHMPCSFCPYQSVCRFESHTQPARALEAMSRKDVLLRVGEATS